MKDRDDDRNTLNKCEKCASIDVALAQSLVSFEDLRSLALSRLSETERKDPLKSYLLSLWNSVIPGHPLRTLVLRIIRKHEKMGFQIGYSDRQAIKRLKKLAYPAEMA